METIKYILIVIFSLSIFLSGCQTKPTKPTAAEQEIDEIILQQAKSKISNRNKKDAVNEFNNLLENDAINKISEINLERFNISVNNILAKDFFYGLVEDTKKNIVVHPNVTGKITLELRQVSIDDVLSITRDIYGYEYRKTGDIYTIYPRELRTEIYKLNYLNVKRVGVSDISINIGHMKDSNRKQDDSINLLGNIASHKEGEQRKTTEITPGSRVQTITETDFWISIRDTISQIIGDGKDRKVVITPHAGIILVKAMPHELSDVREFLTLSELSAHQQVLLEAKIIEVSLNDGFEAGIDWGKISGQVLLSKNVNDFSLPATINEAENNGEIFSSLVSINDITKLLMLLETQGHVQVLSSPRVSTVNNQKAVIRVGSDEYFVTGVTNNSSSNASSTVFSPTIDFESFFNGISLDVTPQISDNEEIILHIHPVITKIEDQEKEVILGDSSYNFPLALRDVRETDSIVRAKSGQVLVLGGLMQETVIDNKGRRPWLGRIPLLNIFFKTSEKKKVKTELVILLRPVVVKDDTWDTILSETQANIKEISDTHRNKTENSASSLSETKTNKTTETEKEI